MANSKERQYYYGVMLKKYRAKEKNEFGTYVGIQKTSDHFSIGKDKFFRVSQLNTKEINGDTLHRTNISINTQMLAYIHSRNNQQNFSEGFSLSSSIYENWFKENNMIAKAAKEAQQDFINMFKSQGVNEKTKKLLQKSLDTNFDFALDNMNAIDNALDSAIKNSMDLAGIQSAREAYAQAKTLQQGEENAITKIVNGTGVKTGALTDQAFEALDALLSDIETIYNFMNNESNKSRKDKIAEMAVFRQLLYTKGHKAIKNINQIVKNAETIEAKITSEELRRAVKSVTAVLKKLTINTNSDVAREELNIIKGANQQIKLNTISTAIAEALNRNIANAKSKTIQQLDAYLKFLEHTGNKKVPNEFYQKHSKKNMPKTDVKTQARLKNLIIQLQNKGDTISLDVNLLLKLGLSIKFYQGLAGSRGAAGGKGDLISINIGSSGTIEEFIKSYYPHEEDETRYYFYNTIGQAQGIFKNSYLQQFILLRHFTRLFTTGGSVSKKGRNDFAAYLIVNGVPISMWKILQTIVENEQNRKQCIDLLFNEKENISFKNNWVTREGRAEGAADYVAALMRSRALYETINKTKLQTHLHLQQLRHSVLKDLSNKEQQALSYK